MMDEHEEEECWYEGLRVIYLDEDDEDDVHGPFLGAHEVIAMLRHEAMLAPESGEDLADCLNALADGLAREVVGLMDCFDD